MQYYTSEPYFRGVFVEVPAMFNKV